MYRRWRTAAGPTGGDPHVRLGLNWRPVHDRDDLEAVRGLLRRVDAMRADCVVTLPGSFADGSLAPHPNNFNGDIRGAVRENCRQILDGPGLEYTRYVLERWPNTFFDEPEAIRSSLDSVDDALLDSAAADTFTTPELPDGF